MQQRSSSATTPAEPIAVFSFSSELKSYPTSISSPFRITVEEPPGITAFSSRPPGIPPARPKISSRMLVPFSIS
jgi:hypothetical protein